MNQEIPKPLRNALARQAVGDVHPSPDALTSFMERSLTPRENEVVTHHLAQCAECREIVFLASNAAEDEVGDRRELVAAAAVGRAAAMPVYAASSRPDTARAERARPRWTIRTRWAMSVAAAALLVSGGLVLQYWRAASGYQAAPLTVASNRPSSASPEARQNAAAPNSQEASAKTPVAEMLAETAPRPTPAARAKKVPEATTTARNASDAFPSAPAAQPVARATTSPATAGAAVGGLSSALVPEVRPQRSYVESESAQKSETAQPPQLQQGAPLVFGKSGMRMKAVSAVRPQWRISLNGHLERSMAANQWTRVLDDQPTTFHAVAVVGNDVWAGGNGGAFFHSSDGGEHWSKVSLAANSKAETGAIVSIRFDDPQHGVVASDSGTRWATTNGGITWTTQ